MQRVKLPGTDLSVSPLCLGCWQFNDNSNKDVNWEPQSLETSKAIVDKCFEVGINFFDTAEGYKGSEVVLGKCLEGRRRDAVVATKFGFREGPGTPPYTAAQIDQTITKALTNLQTDYVDLLQIHFPSFVGNAKETVEELNRQVAKGRIRYYGISNYGPKNLRELLDAGGKPISNQMGYNLLWRSVEYDVLPMCRENGISILAYSPLQQGLLAGKYATVEDVPIGRRRGKLFSNDSCNLARHGQPGAEKEVFEALGKMKEICARSQVEMSKASIAWLLQQPGVSNVIVGASSPQQIVDNSDIITLPDSVVKELSAATEPVKNKIGRTLDQWAHPDRCE